MSEANDKLLERIQKLLALADPERNDSQAQIEAALEKIADLLRKHNLTMDQVQGHAPKQGLTHDYVFPRETEGTVLTGRWTRWVVDLGEAVGYANYCKTLHSPGGPTFIGRERDVKIASFMFDNLFHRLVALSGQETKRYAADYKEETGKSAWQQWGDRHPKRWRRAWLDGAVLSISTRLRKARWEEEKEAALQRKKSEEAASKYALITAHNAALEQYVDAVMPWIRERPGLTDDRIEEVKGASDGWLDGHTAGEDLAFQQGVDGARTNRSTAALPSSGG